nr:hypothetical protein BaRGS_019818 [Batillaria attramentaria]
MRQLPLEGKVRLLDVGSCYNPFCQFDEFLPIAIDISPANECDFLSLEITEPLHLAPDAGDTFLRKLSSPIERLPHGLFHVVVFSLLLEYLPAPQQSVWKVAIVTRCP